MSFKKVVSGVILTTSLLASSTSASAASVDYYEFFDMNAYAPANPIYTTDAFTCTNPNNEVIIHGWQDAASSADPADVTYSVVRDVWYGWENWSVPKRITGNYTKSGTWYSHTFAGVPHNPDYHIRMQFHNKTSYADGAGNVYQ